MSPSLFASTSNTSSISMGGSASGYGNAGYAGAHGDQISKALIDESEALGKKYMESYTPGAKKKQVAVSTFVLQCGNSQLKYSLSQRPT